MLQAWFQLLGLLPRALAQRLPLMVVASWLASALIAGWTIQNLNTRSSALSEAETTGEVLWSLVRLGISATVPDVIETTSGPYELRLTDELDGPLPPDTVPLILELDGQRLRAAVAFPEPARLTSALRTRRTPQEAGARLADLSRGIARQDLEAQLVVFAPGGKVLQIRAPVLWQDRLGQTWVVLMGGAAFALGLSVALALSRHLVHPFRDLSRLSQGETRPGPLDSTEALLIGDRIRWLSERFRRDQERKSRGLAAISHDLRTPVTRMRLRSELLDDDVLREKFGADLDEISSIVDGALDLLSIRAQAEEFHRFSLVSLLESLVSDYQDVGRPVEFAGTQEIELQAASSVFATGAGMSVRPANECLMEGQPDKLRRAFTNLIDNALKYGGRAIVRVQPDAPDHFEVSVEDFGPGIAPDQADRVTLPFFRGHATPGRGVGLGLSIASEILELHGGSLQFTNTESGLLVSARVARQTTPERPGPEA